MQFIITNNDLVCLIFQLPKKCEKGLNFIYLTISILLLLS